MIVSQQTIGKRVFFIFTTSISYFLKYLVKREFYDRGGMKEEDYIIGK